VKISHARIFTNPFDEIQVLETVPAESTALLSHTPGYGDENGAVHVVESDNEISLTYLGQYFSTYQL